jgi:hypothetical protein
MNGMRNRVVILVVAITAIVGMLACSAGSLLSRTEPTATPTKTPKPTFTVTLTPTETSIPTDTPLPTDTPTPVTPTNTPIVYTATFTPEPPTDTPTPTDTPAPTNTTRPRPRPTSTPTRKPQPTNTPAPSYAFTGSIAGGTVNCGTTGIKGKIKTKAGGNYAGVTVAVWTDGWEGAVANPSDLGGNWEMLIGPGARAGNWYVAVVKAETCQPKPGGWTATGCERQSNVITVVTTAHCQGEGAVQWPEVEFRQN